MNITFPRADFGLTLTYNPHKGYFGTVREEVEHDVHGFSAEDWISPEEMTKGIATDEIWTLQWYPETSVGCYILSASTLEALMEHVNKHFPS